MTSSQGVCINFGGCTKADKHEIVNIPQGTDAVCSECGSRLKVRQESSRTPVGLVVVGLIFLAIVTAGAWFLMHRKPVRVADKTVTPTPAPATTPSNTPSLVRNVLLRFEGSNTIGVKLVPELAKSFLERIGDTDVRIIPGANEEELSVQGKHDNTLDVVEIKAHGSGDAFKALKSGECDIGMASRKIKPTEVQELQASLGDLTSDASENVLALDGVAVIVNQANPVRLLTMDQLARIFSGEIKDWSQAGGASGPISLYAYDEKSGTFDFFSESVLKPRGKKFAALPATHRFEDGTKLSDGVAADPSGIGFIALPFVGVNKALAVGDTGVAPRKPGIMTVKTEDYLLSRRLYLYMPAAPKNPNVSKFIEFALGPTIHPIVANVGFISMDLATELKPTVVDSSDPRAASAEWRRLTAGATELPTRMRFRSGSSLLDTRANRDIGRIAGVLSSYNGGKLILIGFADGSGSPAANKTLSHDRASVVERELSPEGVTIANIVGLGAAAFVASNETPDGREKNRRVEVWVRK